MSSSPYKCKMMVINNKRTHRIQFHCVIRTCFWIYSLGFMLCYARCAEAMDTIRSTGLNCTVVRPLFEARGINAVDLPKEPINGKDTLFKMLYCFIPLKDIEEMPRRNEFYYTSIISE